MKCLCATTRRTARMLTLHYEASLRPAGMTPSQFELMGMVAARPGMSQAELAEALALDQTTLSRNVRVLAGRGWLAITAAMEDRRRGSYTLTKQGRTAWTAALPLWQTTQRSVERTLGPEATSIWTALERLEATAARM